MRYDSMFDYRRDRGGEGAVEVDYGYDWWDGDDRYRISYNPETGDVYAVELAAQARRGSVELIATGIVSRDVVDAALWLDEADDESQRVRAENDETTTLAWARRRLTVGTVAIPDPGPARPAFVRENL